ncbi:eukaryotic translation initiation factor 3 subunit C-like [Paramacrobiotus metropolitanus]|uniref:eukaryotic translation initiation factor 3 subunit C-like n=1 Tax=Paramacrobiotus metropolitanus TaxID=2943436 RepID=UPI002446390D|nr:eukaryotic translation initiation factor 3 subunit C-like [Paramacrobiotus metropolitanus]
MSAEEFLQHFENLDYVQNETYWVQVAQRPGWFNRLFDVESYSDDMVYGLCEYWDDMTPDQRVDSTSDFNKTVVLAKYFLILAYFYYDMEAEEFAELMEYLDYAQNDCYWVEMIEAARRDEGSPELPPDSDYFSEGDEESDLQSDDDDEEDDDDDLGSQSDSEEGDSEAEDDADSLLGSDGGGLNHSDISNEEEEDEEDGDYGNPYKEYEAREVGYKREHDEDDDDPDAYVPEYKRPRCD